MKEDKETVRTFVKRNDLTTQVLLDIDGDVAKKYSVYGIPVSFLIDKQGKVVFHFLGFLDWGSEKMNSLLQSLLDM